MKKKITVALLFGGKSAEHDVSLQSARNIAVAMEKNKYKPILIGIDTQGRWLAPAESEQLLLKPLASRVKKSASSDSFGLALTLQKSGRIIELKDRASPALIDVVFPVLHGPFGEDGTVQGLLKLANLPFVGAGVLGSAIGMDKDVMKRLLKEAGIPVPKFSIFHAHDADRLRFASITKELGLPFFIKPANLGSSVGISKVRTQKEFKQAITEAFKYDSKIILEKSVKGREIECSVLGNDKPIASVPGEVIPTHDFYSYDAKYIDDHGALFKVPAALPLKTIKKIQELSIKTFKTLCCEGMARVDLFVTKNSIFLNEINTIPGFTSISMYPKLWEASGLPFPKLIDTLIKLALERFEREKKLRTKRD